MRSLLSLIVSCTIGALPLAAQAPAPPLNAFMMSRDAELALVHTAAPAPIVDAATIELLTPEGYRVDRQGSNGFACLVLRGWSAPTFTPAPFRELIHDATVRAPICYNPSAARTVLPLQHLRATLGIAGKSAEQIADAIQTAYVHGAIPKMDGVGFAYMFSGVQNLGPGI